MISVAKQSLLLKRLGKRLFTDFWYGGNKRKNNYRKRNVRNTGPHIGERNNMEKVLIGKCKSCNGEIYSDGKNKVLYCPHCGAELSEEIPGFVIDESTRLKIGEAFYREGRGRRNRILAVGAVAAAILITAGASFGFYQTRPNNNKIEVVDSEEPVVISEDMVAAADEPVIVEEDDMTGNKKKAISFALDRLENIPYSRSALIEEMMEDYNGFTESAATYAVQYLEDAKLVDWNEEAVKEIEWLLEYDSFSESMLRKQLTSDYKGFTAEQADYAIDYMVTNGYINWNDQAKKTAESYLEILTFTKEEMMDQLTKAEEYTPEQAEYAVSELNM